MDKQCSSCGGFCGEVCEREDVEPIGEIVEAHGLIAVSIPEMPPVGTKLYAQPLLNQTCCGCERTGGYALYCGWCWGKGTYK
jgi:hypothetical protein